MQWETPDVLPNGDNTNRCHRLSASHYALLSLADSSLNLRFRVFFRQHQFPCDFQVMSQRILFPALFGNILFEAIRILIYD